MYRNFFISILCLIVLTFTNFPTYASILQNIKKRGFLKCGINTGLTGFSEIKANGDWKGFDVDFCKALSAAIFNDSSKVQYLPLNAKERFISLQSKQIDILSRNTDWTLLRETALGLAFRPITYFDGQGFMMYKKSGISSALQLSDASICVQAGTTTETTLADYFKAHNMKYHPIVFERVEEIDAAYRSHRCDVYTGDKSALYALRLSTENPNEHVILKDIISKSPLAPAILQGDSEWSNIVSWTHYALVNAEELGITQSNVDQKRLTTNDPDMKRFLGIDKSTNIGGSLGLSRDWAYQIIKHMGNYGEIFDRNLGSQSALKIPREYNALWSKGGLMYAPPIR
ncbi:amino acid ABC transporter substrate-binding protein [Candidatus Liberibacter solanacearum]|uniref:Amino acid ABC transporter substrate-bindnig protein n=1 Tax=Candidatus Liberibacter solanacearum TaxID=556287 RepID=A0A1V2N946_9HYPH|nr:amino acid ABC transporter substrate-binding protein [Candidatus Liberibacter solanacearum]ONI58503.1 amino acid ABC transporter substrate-bindnig protein [Candidatus Liberibacter solanacearum]ONI60228.1 amino acid ABC transporter substrate-bindnig protein [Candidatus Liberibacter solanacearum]